MAMANSIYKYNDAMPDHCTTLHMYHGTLELYRDSRRTAWISAYSTIEIYKSDNLFYSHTSNMSYRCAPGLCIYQDMAILVSSSVFDELT